MQLIHHSDSPGRQALPYGVWLVLAVVVYVYFPDQLPLGARMAYMAIFVMSLDLVVGYAGLATLGHCAMFGAGAYAAGLWATHVSNDPLMGLCVGAMAGSLVATLSGFFLLRYQGLTFLMMTIAVSQILQNGASKWRDWTGGDDGLSGFSMGKVLGLASFDLQGRVAFLYATVMMLVCLWLMRRIMGSPFGMACVGIHENRLRMVALGSSVSSHLRRIYAVAGFFAGLAGALAAQINQIVGLDTLGFDLSAEALVMLVLGGPGHLHGAIAGTLVFMGIHHMASSINPYHWLFIIGGLLVTVVLMPRERWAKAWRDRWDRLGATVSMRDKGGA